MKTEFIYKLDSHADVELGWQRQEIEVYATLPKAGINEETGLLIIMDDFGGDANSMYQNLEVRPYIADRYNFVVAGVEYFGIKRWGTMDIRRHFVHNINRIYNLGLTDDILAKMENAEELFSQIGNMLIQRGVSMLDLRCQPVIKDGRGEYQSWGFLPAIDGLQSLGFLLQQYPQLNAKKTVVFGQGYGGYVAGLMAKFAPHSFSAVIDKDGYVATELKQIVPGELLEPSDLREVFFKGKPIPFLYGVAPETPWTIEDETSSCYYADSHRKIRSLLLAEHHKKSDTHYYLLQSAENPLNSAYIRQRYAKVLQDFHIVSWQEGTKEQFGSNLQSVFDYAAASNDNGFLRESAENEFTLKQTYRFLCGEKDYVFSYQNDYSLQVSLLKCGENQEKSNL